MKVERKEEEKWVPIVITLESKEEAQYLWHLLNMRYSYAAGYGYENHREVEFPNDNYAYKMWGSLDEFRKYFGKE